MVFDSGVFAASSCEVFAAPVLVSVTIQISKSSFFFWVLKKHLSSLKNVLILLSLKNIFKKKTKAPFEIKYLCRVRFLTIF